MAEEYLLPQVASEVAKAINKALSSVQTVNGTAPDANGNVEIDVPDSGQNVDLTEYAKISDFFDDSANLYDESTNTPGKSIDASTGELKDSELYEATDFIYLAPGKYIITNTSTACFNMWGEYDINKNFKARHWIDDFNPFEPTEPCYVRFAGYSTKLPKNTIMLVAGDTLPTEYIPYRTTLKPKHMPDITGDMIPNGSITPEKTSFVETSSNLINHRSLTDGYVVTADGTLKANVQYAITGKIALEKNTVYTCKDVIRVSFFDNNGVHIKQQNCQDALTTFTTPAEFAYAVVSVNKYPAGRPWQLNKGSELLPYEKQHLLIDGYRVYDDQRVTDPVVTPIQDFMDWDKVCVDKESVFSLTADYEGIPQEQRGVDDLLDKYDALMANHPLYITKTELGLASDGTSTIYRYDFREPEVPHGSTTYVPKKPTVILVSGVHPEFGGMYGLYYALEQIAQNHELIDIRRNVHFIVVPVVNPYGSYTGNRKNANGIDIARNFEFRFTPGTDPTSTTYSGTEALSEPESQYVDAILSANTDAVFFASCHSFQGTADTMDAIWGSCTTRYNFNLTTKLIDKMSRFWREKYDFIPNSADVFLGYSEISPPGGVCGLQACKYGIQGFTLETCDWFRYENPNPHTGFAYSRNAETYVNFIKIALGCWESSDKKL